MFISGIERVFLFVFMEIMYTDITKKCEFGNSAAAFLTR